MVTPEKQPDHIREGYDEQELRELFSDFKSITITPTFDKLEGALWDINYAASHNIPLDLITILKNAENHVNYGWLLIGEKTLK